MARQTARYSGSIDGFLGRFGARLQGLAASHDLLIRESWHGASLRELIQSQLATYFDGDPAQVAIEGPEIALKPEAAQNLGLALHELGINAEQFGALSMPGGRVSVTWGPDRPGEAVMLDWHEQFGPKVKTRRKRGFGSLAIERNLPRAIDAEVKMVFDPEGLRCHIVISASQIVATLSGRGVLLSDDLFELIRLDRLVAIGPHAVGDRIRDMLFGNHADDVGAARAAGRCLW